MTRIIPLSFYEDPTMKKLMVDGLSCILHKVLYDAKIGKEAYVSTHVINLVLKGTLRLENDQGLFEEVSEGKMVLVSKGLYTVSDIMPSGGHFEALMFFFEPDIIRQFLESISFKTVEKGKSTEVAVMESSVDTRFFAESLLRLYGVEAKSNRYLTKMKLFEFLHQINASFRDKDAFPTLLAALNNKERKSMREFMESNFHKPLAIEDYAYLSGRSVPTFTRDFKAKFDGVSPKQWLIERRLEKAYGLLVDNHSQYVTDIAQESGYTDTPHFIKEFQKRFGITPKQFMIKNRLKTAV